MSNAREYNAADTRVVVRPAWVTTLMLMLVSGIYRVYWAWRANNDIAQFARARTNAPFGYAPIAVNAAVPATLMGISLVGWVLIWIFALPWGAAAFEQAADGVPFTLGERIVGTAIGIALLVPGAVSVIRTRARVMRARSLAGLAERTRWTGRWFWPVAAFEIVGIPLWILALQSSLNDLWAHYPPLLDEDLYGELAPPPQRDSAIAQRPALHQARLESIADELGDSGRTPYVTIAFIVICMGMWGYQLYAHGFFPDEKDLENVGGLRRGLDGVWWRVMTANILHGSIEHIAGNLAIWALIGTMLERAVGHLRLVALIVVGAGAASAGALINHPHEVGVGASGVVFAAFGMAALIDPLARRPIGKVGWAFAALGVGLSTFVEGISAGAHLGGLAAGAALGAVVVFVWKVPRTVPVMRLTGIQDRTAPLAPQRELRISERLAHIRDQVRQGTISQERGVALEAALLARG